MRNKKLIIIFSVICALTLLVVFNSVVFSVQHIDVYCYNAEDLELEQRVAGGSGLKKGRSIFTVNEERIAAEVERNVSEARVRNIERKFPNRVCINYVKVYEYLEVMRDQKYYLLGSDGKIMRVADVAADSAGIIELRSSAPLSGTATGEFLFTGEPLRIVTEMLSTLEMLGYHREVVEMVDFIDIRKEGVIYIRMDAGVTIKVIGTDGIFDKLRMGWSIFIQNDSYKNEGTITVSGGTNTYSQEDKYAAEMGNYQ